MSANSADLATKHTVAHMTLRLADGRAFAYKCDFGPGYDSEAARYMWLDGNYSCDCNRSLFLAGYGVEEMGCGDTITLEDFRVTHE